MKCFSHFSLLPSIQKSLKKLGFTEPTTIQSKAFELLLSNSNQDVHAQAQTGTGKTLAFGIPLLQAIDASKKVVQALIMAPTRELVVQIHDSLKDIAHESDITIEALYGGMPIEHQIYRIKQGAQVIIGTPGRINDHLKRKTLNLNKLAFLVLDEADIMLDMGFRQELEVVFEYAPKNRHIWLFSATVMSGIKDLIASHMRNVSLITSDQVNLTSNQVKQYFCIVPQRQRTEVVARFIAANPDFYGIIFCRTRELSGEVAQDLARKGIRVQCLHGDMRQTLRNKVIKDFKGKVFNVLVATDVAARGIDVSNLTYVINYNMPDDNESYVHRIGRTGRAGKEGNAILLVSPSEMYRMRRLERIVKTKLMEIAIPSFESVIRTRLQDVTQFVDHMNGVLRTSSPVIDNNLMDMVNGWEMSKLKVIAASLLKEKFFHGMQDIQEIEKGSKASSAEKKYSGHSKNNYFPRRGTHHKRSFR